MPTYMHKQLTKYDHPPPKRQQNCPYAPEPRKYGKSAQEITPKPDSPSLMRRARNMSNKLQADFSTTHEQSTWQFYMYLKQVSCYGLWGKTNFWSTYGMPYAQRLSFCDPHKNWCVGIPVISALIWATTSQHRPFWSRAPPSSRTRPSK